MAQQIDVSDAASLRDAIGKAAPGSTIRLAPGDYSGIEIKRSIEGAPVSISGPRGARLIQMKFTAPARNWQVRGITLLAGTPGSGPINGTAITFTRARDIALDNVLLHGVAPGKDAWNEGSKGVVFTRAEAIVIANSEIRHVRVVGALQDSRGLVLANNRFEDARDGLLVSNVQGLAIRGNLFRGWVPRYDRKEHPDMIQFWTRNRPTGSARVEISNNLLHSGQDRAVQGIFARAEDHEKGKAPQGFHRDWVIRNNIYFGSSKHGISLSDVQGVLVENNTVLASPHAFVGRRPVSLDGRSYVGFKPFILLLRSTKAEVRNNLAPFLTDTTQPSGVTLHNNELYKPASAKDAINPGKSFAAPLTAGIHDVTDFSLLPQSAAARKGRGADAGKVGPQASPQPVSPLLEEARKLADVDDPFLADATPKPVAADR